MSNFEVTHGTSPTSFSKIGAPGAPPSWLMPHTFCFLRPEGPSVNRPGRQAGIGRVNKMSTEGAAHLRGRCGTPSRKVRHNYICKRWQCFYFQYLQSAALSALIRYSRYPGLTAGPPHCQLAEPVVLQAVSETCGQPDFRAGEPLLTDGASGLKMHCIQKVCGISRLVGIQAGGMPALPASRRHFHASRGVPHAHEGLSRNSQNNMI
jgi:hypothetical protein